MIIKTILTGLLTIDVLISVQEIQAIAQPEPQVLLAGSPKASSDWVRFTSRKRGFSTLVPRNAKIIDQLATDGSWKIDGNDSDAHYAVGYYEIDTRKLSLADDRTQQYFLDQMLNSMGKEIQEVSRTKLTIRGYPGREARFRSQGKSGWIRIFFVRNRMYVMTAENNKVTANERNVTDFLQSFGLF